MMMKKTKQIKIGNLYIGGHYPILIQSMTTTKTADIEATVNQILALETAGCDVIRVAVPDMASAEALSEIKRRIHIPLVADIHFDYRLALKAIEMGVDKIRINPGNIGDESRIKQVVDAAKKAGIPIRIGVNSGSLEKHIYDKYQGVTAEGLVESALYHVALLEKFGFTDIVISIKASDIKLTVEAYRLLAQKVDYPLHLGITEAGTVYSGTIKSAIGIGIMLYEGIGQTIRVSLTGDPIEEIKAAKKILEVLELRHFGIRFISCPTCGRTEVDLVQIAHVLEERLKHVDKNITLAIMGCAVNGPGEARGADLGIAGGKGEFLLFKKGLVLRKVKADDVVQAVIDEIETM